MLKTEAERMLAMSATEEGDKHRTKVWKSFSLEERREVFVELIFALAGKGGTA